MENDKSHWEKVFAIKAENEVSWLQPFPKTSIEKIRCISEDHITPFNTTQNFLFCSFKKK